MDMLFVLLCYMYGESMWCVFVYIDLVYLESCFVLWLWCYLYVL